MADIDAALARLRDVPVHPRLASIDAAVLERVALDATDQHPLSVTAFGMAAISALSLGIASSVISGMPASAASNAPFGTPSALAPSSLLGSGE